MAAKISTVKNTETARRKYSSWSTSTEIVDACSGNRGICIVTLSSPLQRLPFRAHIAPPGDQHPARSQQKEPRPRAPQQTNRERPVLARRRIVVIAEQQCLVGEASDLVLRRLHQAEPQIQRRVFDRSEIARKPAFRGQNHNPAGV